eukprot:TRINITY_DN16062_c0_g1_i1.p2 TRINITY_DN16062_c0_g1~~TRINITY_DN16062_c0_g1_i1.p2  ORF type:complete len:168 (-),score=43.82 TRINITY_DN16062_c0_g1_i1:39-542(-)
MLCASSCSVWTLRVFDVLFVVFCIACFVFQQKNQDVALWVINYIVALACCVTVILNKLYWLIPFCYTWALFGGVVAMAARSYARGGLPPCLSMHEGEIPACQELLSMFGLLIMAIWMAIVTVWALHHGTIDWTPRLMRCMRVDRRAETDRLSGDVELATGEQRDRVL